MTNVSLCYRPIASAFTLGVIGDLVCQKFVEKEEKIDWGRHRAFVTFATFYQGAISYRVYGLYTRFLPSLLTYILPRSPRLASSPVTFGLASTVADNFLHSPLLYLPLFFITTGLLQGQGPSDIKRAMDDSYFETIRACLGFWIPLQFVNFALVPERLRVLFVNFGCLLWNIVLDHLAQAEEEEGGDAVLVKVASVRLAVSSRTREEEQKKQTGRGRETDTERIGKIKADEDEQAPVKEDFVSRSRLKRRSIGLPFRDVVRRERDEDEVSTSTALSTSEE